MMPFFNQIQFRQLLKNGSDVNRRKDNYPVIKLFTSNTQAIWLLSEIDPNNHDRAFALCDVGMGLPEFGHLSLSRLEYVRGQLSLPIEQDNHFTAHYPIKVYAGAARVYGRITEEEAILAAFAGKQAKNFCLTNTDSIKEDNKQGLKEFLAERHDMIGQKYNVNALREQNKYELEFWDKVAAVIKSAKQSGTTL